MDITNEMIAEIFEDDAEVIIEIFENSDFSNWEDFFVYSIQNYFNFLKQYFLLFFWVYLEKKFNVLTVKKGCFGGPFILDTYA